MATAAKKTASKAVTATTADKTSVPAKKAAVKRITRSTPASQTGLVNDPAGARAKSLMETKIEVNDPLAVKAVPVNDPLAKVATPSTAKRITRTSTRKAAAPVNAQELADKLKAGASDKPVVPATAEELKNTPRGHRVKRAVGTTKTAKPADAAAVVRSTPAKKVPAPVVGAVKSDIAPAAKKAIKKAADALNAPAKRVIDVTAKKTVATKKPARRVIDVSPKKVKDVDAEVKLNKDLLARFDALVLEIRAAGGKLNGDLQLSALIFNYRDSIVTKPRDLVARKKAIMQDINRVLDRAKEYDLWPIINRGPDGTIVELIPFDKDGAMVSIRAEAGISIKKRVKALVDEAAKHGWVLAVPIEAGKPVIKLYEVK